MRVGDFISAAALLVAACSLAFAGLQIRRTRTTSRYQFLFDTFDRYFRDDNVRAFYYMLDYNQWHFDARGLPGSAEEPALDHLIYTFDMMEKMVDSGAFTESEVEIFGFQAVRVIDNPEVKEYLNWLDSEYSMVFGLPQVAHGGARRFAQRFRGRSRL